MYYCSIESDYYNVSGIYLRYTSNNFRKTTFYFQFNQTHLTEKHKIHSLQWNGSISNNLLDLLFALLYEGE